MSSPKAPPSDSPATGSASSLPPGAQQARPSSPPDVALSVAELEAKLAGARYLAGPETALSLWLSLRMHRPLLVEGPAGVGKTDMARACAEALGRKLIRLQCYEGLDEAKALYEWDYAKQMLFTQLLRDAIAKEIGEAASIAEAARMVARSEATFFNEHFLLARPLLAALQSPTPVVLLIDEVDRADPEFEAFLLEVLSELQVTIPELGTVRAEHPPLVLLTTNATREMTEALRRRCLHAFLDYPPPSRELSILRLHVPGIDEKLAAHVVAFIGELRRMDLRKGPAISEAVDWAAALLLLGKSTLDPALVNDTIGLLLKHQEDKLLVEPRIGALLQAAAQALR